MKLAIVTSYRQGPYVHLDVALSTDLFTLQFGPATLFLFRYIGICTVGRFIIFIVLPIGLFIYLSYLVGNDNEHCFSDKLIEINFLFIIL